MILIQAAAASLLFKGMESEEEAAINRVGFDFDCCLSFPRDAVFLYSRRSVVVVDRVSPVILNVFSSSLLFLSCFSILKKQIKCIYELRITLANNGL